jgi:aspartate dehydrogenase
MLQVTLIGFGAIGQSLCRRLHGSERLRISHVVLRPQDIDAAQVILDELAAQNGSQRAMAVTAVPADARLVLECAGHAALTEHVLPALARGVECAVVSIGALAEPGLPEQLEAAAAAGGTQVHLLSGAIGGVDAIAAARLAGLTQVTYTGRKPPSSWAPVASADAPGLEPNSPQALVNPTQVAIILEASAREAARLYPKNANVAATVALAGLGLDATRVRLLADPGVTENIHEIHAIGAFGEMKIEMRGKPLADNPKTSALTVLSALRFLLNRANPLTI